MAAVTNNSENIAFTKLIIQFSNVFEGDVAIFEAPVTSVLLTMTKVIDKDCKRAEVECKYTDGSNE